jgi:hypothetical protein
VRYFIFLFIFISIEKIRAQNAGNQRCIYSWEIQTARNQYYDFQIYDADYKVLFDWSNQIGKTEVVELNKTQHQINCFQSYCAFDAKDSVVYTAAKIVSLLVDTSVCRIVTEKNLIADFPKQDFRHLVSRYKKIKCFAKKNKQISPKCDNVNYLMMYLHDLELAALQGDAACDKLFFAFEKDFGAIIGASGVEEYNGNVLLVYQLKSQ